MHIRDHKMLRKHLVTFSICMEYGNVNILLTYLLLMYFRQEKGSVQPEFSCLKYMC